jgi:CheY-like chemotaxis protein
MLRNPMPYGKMVDGQMGNPRAIGGRPVLVVDDDLDIREILSETLEDLGFEILTAANGREALTVLRGLQGGASAILLDLMMPVMDGYGFLEARAQDPRLASIPIVVVTAGHGIDNERIGAAIPIIRKPFDLSQLVNVLDRVCGRVERPV